MTYQFTRTQLESIEFTLSEIVKTEAVEMYEKLLISLIYKLCRRLKVKLIDYKKKYSVAIDAETEIAMYLYFEDKPFAPTYSQLLIKNICDNAEKQYA